MEIGKYYKSITGREGRYSGEGLLAWEVVAESTGKFTPKTLTFVVEEEFGPAEEVPEGMEQELIPL